MMNWEEVFSIANTLALPGWVILVFLPRRWRLLGLVPRLVVPMVLSVIYVALIGAYMAQSGGGFGSILQVRTLFASDPVLIAGWTHYLAFDLLIAVMIADQLDRVHVHRLVQAPILLACFMFGPLGYLLGMVTAQMAQFRQTRAVAG